MAIFGRPASHYAIVGTDSEVQDVLVFHHEGERVIVDNTACSIRASSLSAFRDWLFAGPRKSSIHLSMFSLNGAAPRPSLCHPLSNDAVIRLPGGIDEYLSGLGTKTRQHVRNYRRRIEKEHPGVEFAVVSGATIPTRSILRIIDLHRSRMAAKEQSSSIDEEYAQRLVQLMRECGLVVTAAIDGRIVGGALLTRVDDDCFLHVIAHDQEFNKYSLGMLCLVYGITDLIRRGAHRLHLLWGQSDYKTRLGAVDTELYSLVLYRHRRSLVGAKLRELTQKAAVRAGLRSVS